VPTAVALAVALGLVTGCSPSASTTTPAASSAAASTQHRASHHRGWRRLHGTITQLSAGTLTVVTERGKAHTFAYSSSTTVHRGRTMLTVAALHAGETVTVRYKPAKPSPEVLAIRIAPGG
jgi:hypothetical protein